MIAHQFWCPGQIMYSIIEKLESSQSLCKYFYSPMDILPDRKSIYVIADDNELMFMLILTYSEWYVGEYPMDSTGYLKYHLMVDRTDTKLQ